MGKHARIAELEAQLAAMRKRVEVPREVISYIERLAQMPDDAVLLYAISGSRVSHEIGRSARIVLDKIKSNA